MIALDYTIYQSKFDCLLPIVIVTTILIVQTNTVLVISAIDLAKESIYLVTETADILYRHVVTIPNRQKKSRIFEE